MLRLTLLIPLLALLAVLLAGWGWSTQTATPGLTAADIAYRAVGSVLLLTFYGDAASYGRDWRVEAARWVAVAFYALIATKAVAALLARQLGDLRGRLRADHILVAGDHDVALGAAQAAGARHAAVTWITEDPDHDRELPGALVVRRRWEPGLATHWSARRARVALIAFNDEVRQLAVARQLRAAAPALPIILHCNDVWLGERLDELEHLSGVRVVSDIREGLRALHWRQPPFLIAEALGQPRIHALVIGFGHSGEAVLVDLLLAGLTSDLGPPRITIVDPRAREIKLSLAQRCPELTASIDLALIAAEPGTDERLLPCAALAKAAEASPITCGYVCLNSDRRTIGAAVALAALARREGWAMGPVFARLRTTDAVPPATTAGAGIAAFGAVGDFGQAIGLFDAQVDQLPRRLHEAYRRAAPGHTAANLPWEALREEHREANRHQLAHLPAKLYSAGFDLRGWLAGAAPPLPDPAADPLLLERLAALEHRRWMAERRLTGWRYGAPRDNGRRLHPDLVDYALLSEASRQYDRELVLAAFAAAPIALAQRPPA